MIGKDRMNRSSRLRLLSYHVGCKHGYLEKVWTEDVRTALKSMETKGLQQIKQMRDTKIVEYSMKFSKCSIVCPLCEQSFSSAISLKSHLANRHFQNELLDLAGLSSLNKCPLCPKQIKNTKDKTQIAAHIALKHKYIDRVMPVEMKTELNRQLASKFPQSALFDAPKLKFNQMARDSVAKDHDYCQQSKSGGYRHIDCMLCEAAFDDLYVFREHLILVHFKVEILKRSGATDARKCNLCSKTSDSVKLTKTQLITCMAAHLGNVHKLLEEVMPEDARQRLKEITQLELSSGRGWRKAKSKRKGKQDPLKV